MSGPIVDSARMTIRLGAVEHPCRIGRGGAIAAEAKREGDGCTPRGVWPLRTILLRRGRIAPPPGLRLPWRWTLAADGWSDDPRDPAYNRPVRHPNSYSAEHLRREDGLYDVIVTLGHNDTPPVPGAGSAIFLHCASPGRDTEGCVAMETRALLALLAALAPGDTLTIV